MSQCSCFGCCVPLCFFFFFPFKANAISAHLFYELMTSRILRCSQPSHRPPEPLAVAFVNHSSLTNFASQVVFSPSSFYFPPLLKQLRSGTGSFADKRGFVVQNCLCLSCKKAVLTALRLCRCGRSPWAAVFLALFAHALVQPLLKKKTKHPPNSQNRKTPHKT